MFISTLDPPQAISAIYTTPTTITVYWSHPNTCITPDRYDITYFAGAGDTTGTVVMVSNGSVNSHEISGLDSTVTYHVSIVSITDSSRSDTVGPVLAARGEHIHGSLYR